MSLCKPRINIYIYIYNNNNNKNNNNDKNNDNNRNRNYETFMDYKRLLKLVLFKTAKLNWLYSNRLN